LKLLLKAVGLGFAGPFAGRRVWRLARILVVLVAVLVAGMTPLAQDGLVARGSVGAAAGNGGAGGQTLAAGGCGKADSVSIEEG
jgi:hypothetical protein